MNPFNFVAWTLNIEYGLVITCYIFQNPLSRPLLRFPYYRKWNSRVRKRETVSKLFPRTILRRIERRIALNSQYRKSILENCFPSKQDSLALRKSSGFSPRNRKCSRTDHQPRSSSSTSTSRSEANGKL